MSSLLPPLLVVLAGSSIAMAVVWAIAMRLRNVGYVDVAWAGLMAVSALYIGATSMGSEVPRSLVVMFGCLWGMRLCLHLLTRVLHEPEDGRYQALRVAWNGSPVRFFLFFQMQALVVALFSLPYLAAASRHGNDFDVWTLMAVLVFVASIAGESLADRQLMRFRNTPDNRGKTCRIGLWAWSRHPNYFFEWLHWFSYVLLAVGSEWFWYSLAGPVVMFAFLYRVSGIPWTEAQSLRSRGDDYRRYQAEVSAFFPWPPGRA